MKTLFKNGFVIDGSGEKGFHGDVLVEGEKIVEVAPNIDCVADEVIDCTGLTVSPGWIDAHSHNDFFVDREDPERFFEPFVRQGITTQITGNCGFSPFGLDENSPYADKVGGGLFHARRVGAFCDFVRNAEGELYVNIVPLIGHGTVRIGVSGYEARSLTEKELEKALSYVDEAMEGGAFGGSLGLMYEPGIYSGKEELIAFAKRVAKYGGILTVHPRACSKVALGFPLISKPHLELALDEVADIMRASGVKTEFSHLIFVGETSWKSLEPMLAKFRKLREEGFDIAYDNYSFEYGASVITVVLPAWYMQMDRAKRNKGFPRFKLKTMVWITKKLLGIDFEDFTVAYISPEHKEYEGKTVAEIAREEGATAFDTYIKLVELSNGQGRMYLGKYYNRDILKRLMRDDLSVFMTDAWVEEAGVQNGAAYQAFPLFYKLAEEFGVPTETVVNKMTLKTAERFGIKERGKLAKGFYADITVFAPDRIKVKEDEPDYTPEGVEYVYVNGKAVLKKGEFLPEKNGKVILKNRS